MAALRIMLRAKESDAFAKRWIAFLSRNHKDTDMAAVPAGLGLGLVPHNIRQPEPESPELPDDIHVEMADPAPDQEQTDDAGNVIKIEHDDGSITISLDGSPLTSAGPKKAKSWFDNLVDDIEPTKLSGIAEDLLRGIDADLESRKEWIETREQGLRLLGLKIEMPNSGGGSPDGAPVEGMSKVRHPLLLEAVLRFQANARSELLPTDGPVKIRNDDNDASLKEDQLANALERDLNHYLTAVAHEYYPDTDRMLLLLGFGGTTFKKVYFCPLRNRPVSESVDADDLIVNQAATDLQNAKRKTHRVFMRPSTVKRLQILGVYKDIELSDPIAPTLDSLQREEKAQQGIAPDPAFPDDRDREIYECYCELDLPGFEHKHKGKDSGLEIPYRVTIDVSTREIMSVVRNYNEDDQELPTERVVFQKYSFVPGFGFYDIGLLHILGNTTNAITAAWREMLDAGMFSSFPGFLTTKQAGRQATNIFRVPPGGGVQIDTGGLPINQAVMPLPYQPPSQALMLLVDNMAQTGQRIGGTAEMQVGEGKAEAPVGTTLAMIEQATKVLNAVHKRMHSAQSGEFKLLVECFKEHPDSFWKRGCRSKTKWNEDNFKQAIANCELVPQADPNTASHAQRVMKIMALKQLQSTNPSLYDPIAIDTAALQAIGWNNPQQFMVPKNAQAAPPPEMIQMQEKVKNDGKAADAKMITAQAKAKEVDAKIQSGEFGPHPEGAAAPPEQPDPAAEMTAQARLMDAETKRAELGVKHHDLMIEDQNRDLDRQSREKVQTMELVRDILGHSADAHAAEKEAKHVAEEAGKDRKHEKHIAASKPKPKSGE